MEKIELQMALDTLAGAYAKPQKQEDGTIRYVLEGEYKKAYDTLKEAINNIQ